MMGLGPVRYVRKWIDTEAKINAEIARLGSTGGEVELAPTTIEVTSTVSIPSRVALKSPAPYAAKIKAAGAFPVSTPVVSIGDGTTSVFGVGLIGINIDCNHVAGSIGLQNLAAEEGTIVQSLQVFNFGGYGLHHGAATAAAGNMKYTDLWLAVSKQASTSATRHILADGGQVGGFHVDRASLVVSYQGTNVWATKPDHFVESTQSGKLTSFHVESGDAQVAALTFKGYANVTVVQLTEMQDPPVLFSVGGDTPHPKAVGLYGILHRARSTGHTINDQISSVTGYVDSTDITSYQMAQGKAASGVYV